MRFLAAGSDGLLVEVADLGEALALFASLSADPPAGVRELVPAARTVLIRFDPLTTDRTALSVAVSGRPVVAATAATGPLVEVRVAYDGPDLVEVAERCGLDPAEVVRRHTASPWTVAFTGFAPGFAYLSGGDPVLDVARRTEPRVSIPAGSVGLAGSFSGVYPRATPGGWQLIGRTDAVLWDARRAEPALLAPGMRVRFVDVGPDGVDAARAAPEPVAATREDGPALEVIGPGPLSVVVDLGRPGHAAQGVSRSGAVDRTSLRRANRLVGNPSGAPAIEVAGGGLRVRARGDLVVAVTGASAPLTRPGPSRSREPEHGRVVALDDGDELELGAPDRGMLVYLAVRGGITGEPVLGSVSSDLLSHVGPAPLGVGTVLAVGTARESAVALDPDPGPRLPTADEVTEIEVVLGPRDDWFGADGVRTFLEQEWTVTPRSNRVGLRLAGDRPLELARTDELPSEPTVPGSIQVPPNGQPVVFTADHPVTGGYPVIACVTTRDQDRIGQVPIGGRIRFRALAQADPSRTTE